MTDVTRSTTTALLLCCLALADSAHAQVASGPERADALTQTRPAPRRPPTRSFVRGYVLFDSTTLSATKTFDAVIGVSRVSMLGGGGEILDVWKGLFGRVAASSTTETGSRVVVFDDEVIALGIPLTVELKPLELAAGWRFRPLLNGRLIPYAGAGLLRMGYKETSDFATDDEDTDETFSGSVVFGGVEASLIRGVIAGAEVQYRRVPNALGAGGASEAFGETDLGGVTVRVLVGFRR